MNQGKNEMVMKRNDDEGLFKRWACYGQRCRCTQIQRSDNVLQHSRPHNGHAAIAFQHKQVKICILTVTVASL